jgi:Ser/Thr protein kinase RdoA (MazF antagonist)
MTPGESTQVEQAGDLLGRMHVTLTGFRPAGRKDWRREFHMGTNIATLEKQMHATQSATSGQRSLAERMLAAGRRVAEALDDERFARLPTAIAHGDYTWANVMFRDGAIAGVFDFDWTCRLPYLEDVARAVLFMAFPRDGGPNAHSIWSLVAPWRYDLVRAHSFLDAYARHHPLSTDERSLLPWYVRECWLCCRIRAMRKVADDRKLEILTFGMDPILQGWGRLDELAR